MRSSIEFPELYFRTNTLGLINILEGMRRHGVKKLVLASTSSLYAGCPKPFTEDQPVNTPISPYAASKKAAEICAYSYHNTFGIDVTVLRYFTVFGPAGRPDMAPLRFIKSIDENIPIELFGDGTQARDFTYIDDVAQGTVMALKPLNYEIINLGGGRSPLTLNRLIEIIEIALDKKATILAKPFHQADMIETSAEISRASRILGWKPQIPPEAGIRLTVDWHIKNREWLKQLNL